jgi:hypothetical protein
MTTIGGLNPDFRDFLLALAAEGAEFLIVGAGDFAVPGTVYQIGLPPRRID